MNEAKRTDFRYAVGSRSPPVEPRAGSRHVEGSEELRKLPPGRLGIISIESRRRTSGMDVVVIIVVK